MDRGAWRAIVHGVTESDRMKWLNVHAHTAAQERPKKKEVPWPQPAEEAAACPRASFLSSRGHLPTSHTHCLHQVPLHLGLIFPVAQPAQAVTQEGGSKEGDLIPFGCHRGTQAWWNLQAVSQVAAASNSDMSLKNWVSSPSTLDPHALGQYPTDSGSILLELHATIAL